MAVETGFEPAIRFPAYTLSKRAPSTTRPLHRLPHYITDSIFHRKIIFIVLKKSTLEKNFSRNYNGAQYYTGGAKNKWS